MAPLRHIQLLSSDNDEDILDEDENWIRRTHPPQVSGNFHPLQECLPVDHPEALLPADFPEARLPDDSVLAGVSQQEHDAWNAKINHYHRAAGHPMAEISFDFFEMPACHSEAMDFKCPACESLKRGGRSSGNVPPAATHPLPAAWEAIGLDASEWLVPHSKIKLRFLLMMDLATKLKSIYVVAEYTS